ncbi:MAG TPA: cyclic nucleotide-binding domain-containing protein [Streptosporangiaceae bacterium]|nr:cyclic nucleotide-binding domain-containing protein [Streptosporangiaceae bacterium]
MSGVSVSELSQHAFASGLTAGQLERLAALAVSTDIPAGCRLFDEGGPAARLWLVRTGRIALDLEVPGRERIIVETLGPGDELGLSWLTPAAQWQFGAIAQLPVSAFELSSGALIDLCEADHELGYQLTRRLLDTAITRLQAARIRILDLYAAPAPAAGATP